MINHKNIKGEILMALSNEEKLIRTEERRLKRWNDTHKFIDGIDHKLCSRCDEYHPATEEYFYLNEKNGIDGLYPYCRKQAIQKSSEWINENREDFRASMRKYNATEERKLKKRDDSEKSRKKGTQKLWNQLNKDKRSKYNKERSNKNHDIAEDEWKSCKEYWDYSCAYCGKSEIEQRKQNREDFHKEHFNDEGANDLSNCIPSCTNCNCKKWTFKIEQWYNINNPNYSLDRFNKIIKWINDDHKLYIRTKIQ